MQDIMLAMNMYQKNTKPMFMNGIAAAGLDGDVSSVSLRDLMMILNIIKQG
ncbi:MAG TPA: hypothetical protein H9671_08330 [Firmicutes bacterium]|nr:hypothetical protein [Bacillota bacterium]